MKAAKDYRPMTVVTPPQAITYQETVAQVQRVMHDHGDVLQKFHEIWYGSPFTWGMTSFLGVGLMKSPNDLWMYQHLITQVRPKTIIETGTYQGGSARWFAFLMDALEIDGGRILTIDYKDQRVCTHPRITFFEADSRSPELLRTLVPQIEYPLLVSLDADHSEAHVLAELELYAPLCRVGDWLIVEDTNVSWPNDRGAAGGLRAYLERHPNEWLADLLCERYLLTMHPAGWLVRMGACPHGRRDG